MPNYIVSYDLNGPRPTHAEMDAHVEAGAETCGRILETVWYYGSPDTIDEVYDHLSSILGDEDRLLVVLASEAAWHNLLVDDDSLSAAWRKER